MQTLTDSPPTPAAVGTPRVRLGAHVGGGLKAIPAKALEIGCEAVQVFASSPQMWRPPSCKPEEAAAFREACGRLGLGPIAIHAIYLVNPASEDPELRARTASSLLATLRAADLLGAELVVTHLGSARAAERAGAIGRACAVFAEVLEQYEGGARLLLETSAGAGATLGGTFEEVGEMVRRLGAPDKLGVCIDTAHVFTSGHDLRTAEDLEATLERFDREVGLDRLGAVHLNDSKAPFGSNKDRHENLGDGEIGAEALARFVRHPALGACPLYLEVPGHAKDGPDRPNMERLYAFAGRPFPTSQDPSAQES
jgi:deoxyribonuclease-4